MTVDGTDQVSDGRPGRPHMLFPNEYVWFVFVSTLDVMLTWAILGRGGAEVNPIARVVIERGGLNGAILFKFSLMLFVILVCEYIGRHRLETGRWLARLAVVISGIPPAWSLALLTIHTFAAAA